MITVLHRINQIGKYRVSFIVFLFFLLFAPPVVPAVNTALFSALAALILLCTRYRKEVKNAFFQSKLHIFSLLMIAFFLYLGVVTLINLFLVGDRVQTMHYIKLWYRFFLIVPVLVICALYVCLRGRELGYGLRELGMSFVWAATAQFVLVLLSFLIPSVRWFFVDLMVRNGGSQYLSIGWILLRRGFGFSNSLLDSFGWGIGIIAALPVFLMSKKNRRILLFVPLVIFIAILNVRTGLIIAALGAVSAIPFIVLEWIRGDKKDRLELLLYTLVSAGILAALILLVWWRNPITLRWIAGDVSSIVGMGIPEIAENIQTDAQTTTAETLFSDRFWNLPLGWTLVFGSGHTIYEAAGYPHSDVGYINDLWMGGAVGSLILYFAFFKLFQNAWKAAKGLFREKDLILFLAISLAVFQVKANAIMFNCGLAVTVILVSYITYKGAHNAENGCD